MDRVVGFPIHRGVLAVAERGPMPAADALLDALGPGPKRVLVLASLANHDNVGGIFRNAAAFGVDAVLLDETTCDPLYRKSIRVSVGGALVVPFTQAPIAEILSALAAQGFTVYGLSPQGPRDLRTLTPPPRYALLLGAEGPGLPEDLLARTEPVRIDMAPGFDSLNVSVTAGIALFALGATSSRESGS
jgi:tRNA G18 (ribose-2'-O)-methylase SpoU